MLGPDDLLTKVLFFAYLAMALYYGWSQDDPQSIPITILRGALWPITMIVEWARVGYVPA